MYSNDDIRAKIQEAERIKAQENQRNQEAEARRERERAEWARNDATVQRQREKSGELSSLHEKKERLLREVCQFSVYDANSWFAFHGKARELRNCQHQLDAVYKYVGTGIYEQPYEEKWTIMAGPITIDAGKACTML